MNYRQNMASYGQPGCRTMQPPVQTPNACENICAYPIAMAYVPVQSFQNTYDLNKSLEVGTIFPDLHLPFCGRRCVR